MNIASPAAAAPVVGGGTLTVVLLEFGGFNLKRGYPSIYDSYDYWGVGLTITPVATSYWFTSCVERQKACLPDGLSDTSLHIPSS